MLNCHWIFFPLKKSRIPTSKTEWCLQLHKGNIVVFRVCVIIWMGNYQLHSVSTSEEHLILIQNPSINPPAVWVRKSPTEQRKGLKVFFCGDKTGIRTSKKLSSGAVVKCLCDQKCTCIWVPFLKSKANKLPDMQREESLALVSKIYQKNLCSGFSITGYSLNHSAQQIKSGTATLKPFDFHDWGIRQVFLKSHMSVVSAEARISKNMI